MHFKFLIFRNWKGSADSGENIWRSPYSRKLEGHQVWKDGHVRQPGNHKFFPYMLYHYKVGESISGYGVSSFELQNQFFTLKCVESNTVFTLKMCRYYESSNVNFAKRILFADFQWLPIMSVFK